MHGVGRVLRRVSTPVLDFRVPPHRAVAVPTRCKSPRLRLPRSLYAVSALSPRSSTFPRQPCVRHPQTAWPALCWKVRSRAVCLPACPRLCEGRLLSCDSPAPFLERIRLLEKSNEVNTTIQPARCPEEGFSCFWRTGHTRGPESQERNGPGVCKQTQTSRLRTSPSTPKPSSVATGR